MNCKAAKEISLVNILDKIGTVKKTIKGDEFWYLSPFRKEDIASFKINVSKNLWFDFGSGQGGNVLDFVMSYYRCDLREALNILNKMSYSFSFQQQKSLYHEGKNCEQIISVRLINHLTLKNYM